LNGEFKKRMEGHKNEISAVRVKINNKKFDNENNLYLSCGWDSEI